MRLTQEHAIYAGMVEAMDQAVGKVLDRLDALGLRENTLVIFTSDNGGLSTSEGWPTSNMPLRAGKGWMYEGGLRVPLVVRWPKVARSGSQLDSPVTSPDFFPTLLDAVGTRRTGGDVDGMSFLPAMLGKAPSQRSVFWHYPHYGNQGGAPASAIRRGGWKLIEWLEDGSVELFDVARDIGETKDLSRAQPARARQLLAELKAWRTKVGAQLPRPNPNYDPARPDGRAAARPR